MVSAAEDEDAADADDAEDVVMDGATPCGLYALASRSLAGGVRGFSTVAVASTGIGDSWRESVGRY
jgi:hypothetical protein